MKNLQVRYITKRGKFIPHITLPCADSFAKAIQSGHRSAILGNKVAYVVWYPER